MLAIILHIISIDLEPKPIFLKTFIRKKPRQYITCFNCVQFNDNISMLPSLVMSVTNSRNSKTFSIILVPLIKPKWYEEISLGNILSSLSWIILDRINKITQTNMSHIREGLYMFLLWYENQISMCNGFQKGIARKKILHRS